MSGGSMDYLYRKVQDAEFKEETPLRKTFREHLNKVAAALRAIEWNDSGDGDSDEDNLIRACLGETTSVQVFTVECRTGCSCCSDENHYRGPYSTKEIAEKHVERFRSMPLLSSQFSKTGHYYVHEGTGELLPDGRITSGSKVYDGFKDDGVDDECGRA